MEQATKRASDFTADPFTWNFDLPEAVEGEPYIETFLRSLRKSRETQEELGHKGRSWSGR